jgi:hypothetical protein
MPMTHPDEKKEILMNLIDDMTAAAVDRTSQGYQQFLHCRTLLIQTIDNYLKQDKQRLDLTQSIVQQITDAYKSMGCKLVID